MSTLDLPIFPTLETIFIVNFASQTQLHNREIVCILEFLFYHLST